ncbi:PREDICTED: uncharacterized protein LOC108356150 [Rhagoletis zephyria]|uniref:uncharacterized protein LOC108356150 n=1 Tax=Rhagoletis zephyria TaxID=28612 RepID=UPI00081182E3|nr:PREDICTED: uncharacterized protein LOC108356150 [Rhagoletis zephyria]
MDKRKMLLLAAMLFVKNQYLFNEKMKLLLIKLMDNRTRMKALINSSAILQSGIAIAQARVREVWKFNRSVTFWEYDVRAMDDTRFRENFRLDRRGFQKVCDKVRSIEKMDNNMRRCIPLDKRVAIALFSLGSAAEYRTVCSLFGVGRSTVGKIVLDFCHAVCNNLGEYIIYLEAI